jgi:FKBP-type peptidyl-prolyl cis-trans isomerase FkpA
MKKVLTLALLSLLFNGCLKSETSTPPCSDVPPASEEPQMIAFCHANNITYRKDSSGIFYQILDMGTSPSPTLNSRVSVTYVAKYLDGSLLDQTTTPISNPLNSLIVGWQIGLQLIGEGGHIKMVVPSSLCYGCNGVPGHVPPNAIIYFDVTLTDVQ